MDRDTIAARLGVTPNQVSAVAAHRTMGTYETNGEDTETCEMAEHVAHDRVNELLAHLHERCGPRAVASGETGIVMGTDVESGEVVCWNAEPREGLANPHMLILGESGFGKTYAITCTVTELARRGCCSIVFDYGQGFSDATAPAAFLEHAKPVSIEVSREGVAMNPLSLFPTDIHGPVNVAQRVADTFQRVYPQVGVQQHAVLRQAVLELMRDGGITPEEPSTWLQPPPAFNELEAMLMSYGSSPDHPYRRIAASVASHISTVFVFNTFRNDGAELDWEPMLSPQGRVYVLQLKGLEHSLEQAVTEFLLWSLIGFVEALGPGGRRCFIVLDEAHKLAFSAGSPTEKLLREGRKFGLGVILASQQPEDFSPVAFANTATKLVFQVGDERSAVSRQLAKKVHGSHSFFEIAELITRLPRGYAYFVTKNAGRVVRVHSMEERVARWKR